MPKLTYAIPPPSLMVELYEVAADARALMAELAQANQLPLDFPVEQLQELLIELQTLPGGTAEGCRQPLEYTRSRLPAIRREFIQTEEQSRQPRANQDMPPPLTRGMVIDQRIGALVNSVTTALDEYRALASVEPDDTADTAPSLRIDTTAADAVEAMAASTKAETNLDLGVDQIEKITEATSPTADNLKRRMRDARGLLRIARIELRMPGFVPRWYRNVIEAVKDYPKLIQRSAQAIRIGVDVARPLANAWSHFTHGYKILILDSVEQAAKGLDAVSRKWEAERNGVKAPPTALRAEPDIPPPDFDLEKAREMIVFGQAPPPSWRPWIDSLDLWGDSLTTLMPLAELTALRVLLIRGTKVSDLAPLADLTALQSIFLHGTSVFDLGPLARLTKLEAISTDSRNVTNVAPLAHLTSLRSIDLDGTEVSDLAPLAGLTALRSLSLEDTPVSDVTPLSGLLALESLALDDTRISNLDFAKLLVSLQTLTFNGTQVRDLTPLERLIKLEGLSFNRTLVNDLGPLARLTKLRALSFTGTPVSDLDPLKHLTALQWLYINDTRVRDLAPISSLKRLKEISVENEKRRNTLANTLGKRGGIVKVGQ
jgi:Leucine-rich repeat (LRR) protein